MSLLAHAVYGAPGFEAEKRDLDKRIQAEIREAHRIQEQTNCSYEEALRIARGYTGNRVINRLLEGTK